MIWEPLLGWLHLLAVGGTFGLLLVEYWLCARPLDRLQVRLLGQVDLYYLFGAIAAVATGLARVMAFGKGTDFYLGNPLFWTKMGVFLLIGLTSVVPTRQFILWNRAARAEAAFAPLSAEVERVSRALTLQIGLFVLLPLLAVLVARGWGY